MLNKAESVSEAFQTCVHLREDHCHLKFFQSKVLVASIHPTIGIAILSNTVLKIINVH